jgi:hypothetical protein
MIFMQPPNIELLRAWKPDRFKTPGTNVNIGTKGDVFVLREEQRHELIAINRAHLSDPNTLPASAQIVREQPEALTNGRQGEGERQGMASASAP